MRSRPLSGCWYNSFLPALLGGLVFAGAALPLRAETFLVLPFANQTGPVKPVPANPSLTNTAPAGALNILPPSLPPSLPADSRPDPASANPSDRASANPIDPASAKPSPVDPASTKLDWIGESIAETVRDALGSKGIVTNPRDEVVEAYRRLNLRPRGDLTMASVFKIGEALDAERVLYGTYIYTPDAGPFHRGTLAISARISDRRHLRQSPVFTENGNLDDLPVLEAHLTWRVLQLVNPSLAPPESEFPNLRPPVRLDAEENYVRGLIAASPDQSERYFLQATRLDPKFAHANLELGRIHYARKEYRQAADYLQKIAPEDSHYRDASFLLGLALFQTSDFAGSQKAFQAVSETVPLAEVLNDLGAAESRRNLPSAQETFQKALDGDRNDPVYIFNLGYVLWKKGDFTAAADRFRAVLDRQPDDQYATLLLGMCLRKQGPHGADARLESLERLKSNYDERAYLQLKALVTAPGSNPRDGSRDTPVNTPINHTPTNTPRDASSPAPDR